MVLRLLLELSLIHIFKRVGRKIENSALVNSTYVDILANLERMGDHCQNISESYLLDESAYLNEEPESAFSK